MKKTAYFWENKVESVKGKNASLKDMCYLKNLHFGLENKTFFKLNNKKILPSLLSKLIFIFICFVFI